MTDEIKPKPTFTQCLIHETKYAYVPYFKWLGAFMIFCLIAVGAYVVVLLCPYEIIGQYLKLLPWYVYVVLLILSPPCIYSCIECTRRRIDRPSSALSGLTLIIIACLCGFIGVLISSPYFIAFVIVCGVVGVWLI